MTQMIARVARWAAIPVLMLALSVTAPSDSTASAASSGAMLGQEMNTTMVMVPMANQMMAVTVRMPTNMPSFTQPVVRPIPGGYEIDYGGPSVRIERIEDM